MLNPNLGGLPIQVIVNRDRGQETRPTPVVASTTPSKAPTACCRTRD
jgi:hypothetical protein